MSYLVRDDKGTLSTSVGLTTPGFESPRAELIRTAQEVLNTPWTAREARAFEQRVRDILERGVANGLLDPTILTWTIYTEFDAPAHALNVLAAREDERAGVADLLAAYELERVEP